MNLNVLVAEPCNEDWTSIAKGLRSRLPEASVLRVKDGEQALRLTFQPGLLTSDAQIPHLVLLSAELPVVSADDVLARLRQDTRTRCISVLVLSKSPATVKIEAFHAGEWIFEIESAVALDVHVAEAVRRLCSGGSVQPLHVREPEILADKAARFGGAPSQ